MSNRPAGYYVRRMLAELGFEAATTLPEPDGQSTQMDVSTATRTKIEPFLAGVKKIVVYDDGSFSIE